MAIPDYVTTAILKAELEIAVADTGQDTRLARVASIASRWVDRLCKWPAGTFYTSASAVRYFETSNPSRVWLGTPAATITALATDPDGNRSYAEVWSTTDYLLYPLNRVDEPVKFIARDELQGRYWFPEVQKGVKITGTWGWTSDSTVPDLIEESTLLLALRLWRRPNFIEQITGDAEHGFVRLGKADSDVVSMLHDGRFVKLPGIG